MQLDSVTANEEVLPTAGRCALCIQPLAGLTQQNTSVAIGGHIVEVHYTCKQWLSELRWNALAKRAIEVYGPARSAFDDESEGDHL